LLETNLNIGQKDFVCLTLLIDLEQSRNKQTTLVDYFEKTILDASAILANSTVLSVPPAGRDSHQLHININFKTIRRGPIKRIFPKKAPRERINEQIRVPQIRVIDDAGNQLGIMTPFEALQIAREREMDLVEVAPMAKPPVCRIMDYGKFQYQQSKQDRISKAKQKKVEVKGVRIGVRTDDHDLGFKKDQVEKFLKKGDKVKIEIVLRGREKAHAELARTNLIDFLKSIVTDYKVEQDIKRFPGGFNVVITPNN
jgi:translation initiation factor IF-3